MSNDNPPKCKNNICNNDVKYSKWNRKWNLFCSRSCAGSYNSKVGLKKKKETCLKKYGTEIPQQAESVKKKALATNIERYGQHPSSNQETKDKMAATMLANWGDTNVSRVKSIKEKKEATSLQNYGVKYHMQRHLSKKQQVQLNDIDSIITRNKTEPLNKIALDIGVSDSLIYKRLNAEGIEYKKYTGYSVIEEEITEFIQSLGIEVVRHDRTILGGKELDILIPSHNIAIECNGVFWHTELKGKDRLYHLNKTRKCKDHGIQLIHILDQEWIGNKEIIKSRIRSLVGLNTRIYARKTHVIGLTSPEERLFFNKTHIQGYINSTICLGLEYNREIIAAMSFAKPRFNKDYDWEIIRFSTKLDHTVIGAASKMFKQFIKENTGSVISYADLRYGTGNVYKKMGFELANISQPGYKYVKDGAMFSRGLFRKSLLEDKLEVFDSELSEWQNMQNNRYDRIWDCGNNVWIWKCDK